MYSKIHDNFKTIDYWVYFFVNYVKEKKFTERHCWVQMLCALCWCLYDNSNVSWEKDLNDYSVIKEFLLSIKRINFFFSRGKERKQVTMELIPFLLKFEEIKSKKNTESISSFRYGSGNVIISNIVTDECECYCFSGDSITPYNHFKKIIPDENFYPISNEIDKLVDEEISKKLNKTNFQDDTNNLIDFIRRDDKELDSCYFPANFDWIQMLYALWICLFDIHDSSWKEGLYKRSAIKESFLSIRRINFFFGRGGERKQLTMELIPFLHKFGKFKNEENADLFPSFCCGLDNIISISSIVTNGCVCYCVYGDMVKSHNHFKKIIPVSD